MAFVARTAAQIRDALLSYWSGRYSARGRVLQIAPYSHAWNFASAIGVIQAAIEAQAVALTTQILPDQATGAYLDRHGAVQGVPRRGAVQAQITFQGAGSNGAVTWGTATLQAPDGSRFLPQGTGTTVSGGVWSATFTAQTPGSAGNLPSGTICTWSTPPAGLNPTATVSGVPLVEGSDAEIDQSYQQRIVLVMQDRPASGNRADWQEWALAVDGVGDAYVYPLMDPNTLATAELGAVTLIVLKPLPAVGGVLGVGFGNAAGTGVFDPTYTRIVSGGVLTNVAGYIEGTNDIHGVAPPPGQSFPQLRPVTIESGNYGILAATPVPTTIALTITNDSKHPPTATQQNKVTAATNNGSGSWTLTLASAIADTALVAGVQLLLNTTGTNRGNVEQVTVQTTPTQGTNSITVNNVQGTVLVSAGSIHYYLAPYAPNFGQVLQALLEYFDMLGPADVSVAFGMSLLSSRWPPMDTHGRGVIYPSEIITAVMTGAQGVVDIDVTDPVGGADSTVVPNMFVPPTSAGTSFQFLFQTE